MRSVIRTIIFLGALVTAVTLGAYSQTAKPVQKPSFLRITDQELVVLLKDIGESNPNVLERFKDDLVARQEQLDDLKKLLAYATEAQNKGLVSRPPYDVEMELIRQEVTAVVYDRHVNKVTGATPHTPFSKVSDVMIQNFWGEGTGPKVLPAVKSEREKSFERFIDTKMALLQEQNPALKSREISDAERQEARKMYAQIRIYADEYAKRAPMLPPSLRQKVQLQVKLQQAQFLSRLYAEQLAPKIEVRELDIDAYIGSRPEFDTSEKRAKADEILARAKKGEDFAKLADEFSQDPGNTNEAGVKQGGIYRDVPKGMMVPPFEAAALALEPGSISPALVETAFGFHIVKLERKDKATGNYDVRHILIDTTISDPDMPGSRPLPIREFVRQKLEDDLEDRMIDRIVRANNISVPVDFTIPVAAPKPPAAKTVKKPARKRT